MLEGRHLKAQWLLANLSSLDRLAKIPSPPHSSAFTSSALELPSFLYSSSRCRASQRSLSRNVGISNLKNNVFHIRKKQKRCQIHLFSLAVSFSVNTQSPKITTYAYTFSTEEGGGIRDSSCALSALHPNNLPATKRGQGSLTGMVGGVHACLRSLACSLHSVSAARPSEPHSDAIGGRRFHCSCQWTLEDSLPVASALLSWSWPSTVCL